MSQYWNNEQDYEVFSANKDYSVRVTFLSESDFVLEFKNETTGRSVTCTADMGRLNEEEKKTS